jgi:hypothetical protein
MARRTRLKAAEANSPAPPSADPEEGSHTDAISTPKIPEDLLKSLEENTSAIKALTVAIEQLTAQRTVDNLLKPPSELQVLLNNEHTREGSDKPRPQDAFFMAAAFDQGSGQRFNILAALKAPNCFNDSTMDGNTSLLKYAGGNPAAITSVVMLKVNSSPNFQRAGVQIRSNDCTYLFYVQNLIDKIACIIAGMC